MRHREGPRPRPHPPLALSPFVSQKVASFLETANPEDLHTLKDLIEAEKITPVIDRTYPLSEVPEALRTLQTHHARGKVVITMQLTRRRRVTAGKCAARR